MNNKYIYNIGETYNKVKLLELHRDKNNRLTAITECILCGKTKVMRASDLYSRRTNSCSCQIETHNLHKSRIYAIYSNAKYRCCTETAPAYIHYGGRGIKMCKEWLDKDNGFINFYNWSMDNGYNDNLTIDRIDIDGDYCPKNCRWITKSLNTALSNIEHPRIKKQSTESQSTIEM